MSRIEIFVMVVIGIAIIINFIRYLLNERFDKLLNRNPTKLLRKILMKVDTDSFIAWYLMRVQTELFVDAEYEKYYKDNMLHFVSSNNIYCSNQSKTTYSYSRLTRLIDKIYPEDVMNNTILVINNGFNGSEMIRNHENQEFYNRRVVSNEYINFTNSVLEDFKDTIRDLLKIDSEVLLKVLKEFLLLEIEIHMKDKNDLSSYYVEVNALYERVEVKNNKIDEIINFLIQQDYVSKLYRIGSRLYCSDFYLLYENILSTILRSTRNSKSFNSEIGHRFETTVYELLYEKYKVFRNAYIGKQDNEIDLVVEFGNLLYIIELKAKYYTNLEKEDKSKRNNAKKKIEKGFMQIVKRYNMFKDGADIVLENDRVLSYEDYREVVPIIITLEDMFNVDERLRKYSLPIMVISFDELAGILKVSENVFQFPAYSFNWIYYPEVHQHLRQDKFVDFILRNNYVQYKTPYGIYKEFEIRDLYSMKRIQRQLWIIETMGYPPLISNEISVLLDNSYETIRDYIDVFVMWYYKNLVPLKTIEDLLDSKFYVNDDENITSFVFVTNTEDLSPNDFGFIVDKKNMRIKKVIEPSL